MCVDTAGSIPRAASYIPVAQSVERWSPKPKAAGSGPAGNARLDVRGGRRSIGIAGHLAAKVPDAAAPTPFELIFTNRMCGGMHGCCLFLIKRQKLYKYANLCRKPPKMTLHNTEKIV